MKAKKYYAYLVPGRTKGVTDSWPECEKIVRGIANARYRGFRSREEAEAWLKAGAVYEQKIAPKLAKGIYFDAGTGRGAGVEVSVTDEKGRDLLAELLPKSKVNKFGKTAAPKGATNNFGELLGAKYALELALSKKIKKIFGDSRLILNYWSKGFLNKEVGPKTARLAREVADLRREFEAKGGEMDYISGDFNPADLGFH